MPSKEENARNGLPETDWRDAQYDMLYLPVTETVRYHYDFNGNRTATVLPDGRQINYLYYGSGHLHQISLDDEVITDIERDKLHREIFRTQGKLASRYELDPLGRLKRQIATLNDLTEGGKGKNKVAAGYNQTAVKRSYGYGRTGNLTHSTDQRTGTTHFEYDKLGRITKAGSELFAFDPAHNILSDGRSAVTDNRLKTYNGTTYYYDDLGNLIHRELADGEVQNYFYDLHDQLVKAEIFKKDGTKETWSYTYDALGRRIGKGRLKDGEVSGSLEEETGFVWDGSHLLQEVRPDGRYTYIYTDPSSYEPLAQVRDWTTEDGESRQQTHYFHCDQIGIPREMTDKDGNLLWFGNYTGWGRLKEETKVTQTAHQPFRLQNQYCDEETGLHYNFFRYYDPVVGRFVSQDPIGLMGGENIYRFSNSIQSWIDPLGLDGFQLLRDYANSPGVQAEYHKALAAAAMANHPKTLPASSHTLSIVAEGQGVVGGSGRLSVIHNNFPDGTTGKCLAATICGETGAAERLTLGGEYSYSTSNVSTGWSNSTCVNGSVATPVGGFGSGICTSDPTRGQAASNTFNANILFGGGGGASVGRCTTYSLCNK
nr:RHS repeat-associated core domain-containing protein [Neisseria mucosa]